MLFLFTNLLFSSGLLLGSVYQLILFTHIDDSPQQQQNIGTLLAGLYMLQNYSLLVALYFRISGLSVLFSLLLFPHLLL